MPEQAIQLLPVLIGYILGSVSFAAIIARLNGVPDLRKVGSGNLGATNVWRMIGMIPGIFVFAGDIGKGVLAIVIAMNWSQWFATQGTISLELILVATALMTVIGHVYPVFTGFKGGKGVATGLGVMITMLPIQTLFALGVFIIVVSVFRYISLGSILAALTLAVALLVQRYVLNSEVSEIFVVTGVVLALLVIVTHRENIVRLLKGNENRFSRSTQSKGASSGV